MKLLKNILWFFQVLLDWNDEPEVVNPESDKPTVTLEYNTNCEGLTQENTASCAGAVSF